MSFHVPNKYRVHAGRLGTNDSIGNCGAFFVPARPGGPVLTAIATSDGGWEHVSVSLPNRCPTWVEMCRVKDLFWDEGDCVVEFHPPKREYVNNHRFCLHLWRKIGVDFETPPGWMVGIKELGVLA